MTRPVNEILINNELVKYVLSEYQTDLSKTEPTITKELVNSKIFMKNLLNSANFDILPNNCKFIKKINEDTLIIIEEPPKVRTIIVDQDLTYLIERHKINGKYNEYGLENFQQKRPYKFSLSFPFIVYFIMLDRNNSFINLKLFFRLNPITSLSDYLLRPCLPNINGSYDVCLGYENYSEGYSITERVTDIIDNFWFNRFNSDYLTLCKQYEDVPELCDFFTWQHYTKIDPLFIFSTDWKDSGFNIDEIISDSYTSREKTIVSFLKTIMENRCHENVQNFRIADSYAVGKKILSIGDEIRYKDNNYYICRFTYTEENINELSAELEDENGKVTAITLQKLSNEFEEIEKINNIESIKIDEDTEIKVGDFVFFKESNVISLVQRIIKLKDDTIQIMISGDFYLLTNFLNKRIGKFDENNITFGEVKLEKNKSYYIMDIELSYSIFSSIFIGEFLGLKTVRGNININFKINNGRELLIPLNNYHERYRLISEDNIIMEDVYRINNEIYMNNNNNVIMCILKKTGMGISYYNYFAAREISDFMVNNNIPNAIKYFSEIAQTKTTFTIKSYDKDVTYSIGDEVIVINWRNPQDMFNIRKITGFVCDDAHFYLSLTDDQNNNFNYPIISFYTNGIIKNHFSTVRKVCRNIDNFEIGMKVKAKVKSIPDFPMKDCNQIKAFVIDDIQPLVLFSNYRTMLLEDLTNLFHVYNSNTTMFYKLQVSEPNMIIKEQDCDIFINNSYKETLLGNATNNNNVVILSCSRFDGFHIKNKKGFSNSMRYGLLSPRYSLNQLKIMNYEKGFLNEYGNVIQYGHILECNSIFKTGWSIIS